MLAIRYFRTGKRNQPYFKIVVTDKRRSASGGRFVEEVGSYNPIKKEKKLNAERLKYWISKGAQPSDSVHNLLISEKIIEGEKRDVHNVKKLTEEEIKKAEAAKVAAAASAPKAAPTTEAPKSEEPAKESNPQEKTEEAPKTKTPDPESKPAEKPEETKEPKTAV
jgi:small subunit ribosomal protein S16